MPVPKRAKSAEDSQGSKHSSFLDTFEVMKWCSSTGTKDLTFCLSCSHFFLSNQWKRRYGRNDKGRCLFVVTWKMRFLMIHACNNWECRSQEQKNHPEQKSLQSTCLNWFESAGPFLTSPMHYGWLKSTKRRDSTCFLPLWTAQHRMLLFFFFNLFLIQRATYCFFLRNIAQACTVMLCRWDTALPLAG